MRIYMRALIINGPNLNLLGLREAEHYGSLTLKELNQTIVAKFPTVSFDFFQSNSEAQIIDLLQQASDYHFLLINPGGLAHYSVSLRDAFSYVKVPKGVCHLSNIYKRETFRRVDLLSDLADVYVVGLKEDSYYQALEKLLSKVLKK